MNAARALWVFFLLSITGLGVWLASSLVAYAGGPAALACVGGVLLFPVLPLWWEKRATDALSRAEFLRQPMATPGLAKEHLELKSPSRAVVSVSETFELALGNPAHRFVMVQVMPEQTKCGPTDAAELALSCPVTSGSKEAIVFVNEERDGVYASVASFKVEPR